MENGESKLRPDSEAGGNTDGDDSMFRAMQWLT